MLHGPPRDGGHDQGRVSAHRAGRHPDDALDKLGYNAPIEVYDLKYYRYSDPDYTITGMPLSRNDVDVLQEAVDMLQQLQDFDQFGEMADVINRLQDKLSVTRQERSPIVHYDSVPDLRGLKLLSPSMTTLPITACCASSTSPLNDKTR